MSVYNEEIRNISCGISKYPLKTQALVTIKVSPSFFNNLIQHQMELRFWPVKKRAWNAGAATSALVTQGAGSRKDRGAFDLFKHFLFRFFANTNIHVPYVLSTTNLIHELSWPKCIRLGIKKKWKEAYMKNKINQTAESGFSNYQFSPISFTCSCVFDLSKKEHEM